jgi:hypothetical protein
VGGGMREEFLYTVGRNINQCSHYENQLRGSSKNWKIELPFDLAILVYIRRNIRIKSRDLHTHAFSSTVAKVWNWPRCPSIDEQIWKLWYVYTMDYYLAKKNNVIFRKMGRTGNHHAKWNKSDWERQILHFLFHMQNLDLKKRITWV